MREKLCGYVTALTRPVTMLLKNRGMREKLCGYDSTLPRPVTILHAKPGDFMGGWLIYNAHCRGRLAVDPKPTEVSRLLNGKSISPPLGFPRGEAGRLDGSSEPARLTDEGQRYLKVSDFPVEW